MPAEKRLVYDKATRAIVERTPCPRCAGTGYQEWRGKNLRFQRQNAHISLREMARRGHFSAAYLCDVELNRRQATDRVLALYRSECHAR